MSEYIMRGLAHIGIMTEDPEKCANFYVENLGFRHFHHAGLGEMNIYFVENGGCVLEFVSGKPVNNGQGIVDHVCLEVLGIEALVAELKAKGIEFESENIGVLKELLPGGVKNAFFKGPAGERVELFDHSGVC